MDKRLRLLLVEDSDDDAFLLLRLLTRGGYQVQHVHVQTAESMLKALREQTWDIVICDYGMPHFSGLGALQLLRDNNYDLPFIIISGTIGEEHAVKIIKAGADDYLMKDNLTRLIPAIERAIREAEQRKAHRESEAQVRKLTHALGQSASLILLTDAQGHIEYANQAAMRVSGYALEELMGQNWQMLREAQNTEATLTQMFRVIGEQNQWQGELLCKRKDASPYWVYMGLTAIRNEQGIIQQYLVVQEDITERKRLEQVLQVYTEQLEEMVEERTKQLRHAKEQIEIILNNSNDGIVLALSTGEIKTMNPAFKELFGQRVTKSIEELIYLLSSEQEMRSISQAILRVLYDKNQERTQVSFTHTDGQQIDLDLSLSPVSLEDGLHQGIVISVRDITHMKEIQRFKEEFVANAAHDLSNPISALKTHLFLLKARPEKVNQYLHVLEQQTQRLEILVSELRTLSEIDRGMINLRSRPIDLNDLIAQIVASHQALANDKHQKLLFEPSDDLPLIAIDRYKFDRVVVNLVANAITYTPNEGTVTVRTWHKDQNVCFEVSDTGIGIAPEHIAQIFQRFFRTQQAKDTNILGTGLGLAIVKEMVEAHQGTIEVQSTVNQGSRFIVSLPAALSAIQSS